MSVTEGRILKITSILTICTPLISLLQVHSSANIYKFTCFYELRTVKILLMMIEPEADRTIKIHASDWLLLELFEPFFLSTEIFIFWVDHLILGRENRSDNFDENYGFEMPQHLQVALQSSISRLDWNIFCPRHRVQKNSKWDHAY